MTDHDGTWSQVKEETSDLGRTSRDLLAITTCFAAASLAYWVVVLVIAGRPGFPLDDAFIHLQFARNLHETHQMAFNGGAPSSGSTAPLYPALLAGAYPLTRDWFAASYLVNAVCSLATAFVTYAIGFAWTQRRDLARWAGVLTVLVNPTVAQAFSGMESPVYALLFLIGLACYARRRALASAIWSVGMWLRPEFILLLVLTGMERWLSGRLAEDGRRRIDFRKARPHLLIWGGTMLLYVAYHYHQDGHLLPSTFAAKSIAVGLPYPDWADSLPAALSRHRWGQALFAATVLPLIVVASVFVGFAISCAPLAFGLPRAIRRLWNRNDAFGGPMRFAILVIVGYPWLRGFVDPIGLFVFQQQRYFAHLTPLAVLVVVAALPHTQAVVSLRWWNWRQLGAVRQRRRMYGWSAAGLVLMLVYSGLAVSNINDMQSRIGQWMAEHADEDDVIATNDIGAIGFMSRRPILDTVGLIEPAIVEHYRQGGTLTGYLQEHPPEYVAIFPTWYPELSERDDLLEPVFEVNLDVNVACASPRMVVYRYLDHDR